MDLLFFGIVPCVTSIRDASIISIEKFRGTGKFHKFSMFHLMKLCYNLRKSNHGVELIFGRIYNRDTRFHRMI